MGKMMTIEPTPIDPLVSSFGYLASVLFAYFFLTIITIILRITIILVRIIVIFFMTVVSGPGKSF